MRIFFRGSRPPFLTLRMSPQFDPLGLPSRPPVPASRAVTLADCTHCLPVHMRHHTKTDTEYRKTEKHQVHHIHHDVFLLSFFRSIHAFNVNLKHDDFISLRLIMFNGHQPLSITTLDLPPSVRPPVQFLHADTLSRAEV